MAGRVLKRITDWRILRAEKAIALKYEREAPRPPEGIGIPRTFAYIHYKAFKYLTIGAKKYRRFDYFHLPPKEWESKGLDVVQLGCEQIVHWRGLTPQTALEGLGIYGFYALLHVFHFKLKQQSLLDSGDDTILLDKMEMEHVMTAEDVTLYNKVLRRESPISQC